MGVLPEVLFRYPQFRAMQKLTATAVKQAKPKAKPYKLADGGGLYLHVKTAGKYWRYKCRFAVKEKLLALGSYPDISLADARKLHQAARENLAASKDPSSHKKATKAANQSKSANSFEAVTLEWSKTRGKKAESTEKRQQALLEKDLFPYIGSRPIATTSHPHRSKNRCTRRPSCSAT